MVLLSDGHYLNLPVMNDAGEIVGMVDVLKLTYATLEQVNIPYIYSLAYYRLHMLINFL